MDAALGHALYRPDSPYFQVLLQIFSRLPAEDIARCRTLSRSAHRLLYDDYAFISSLPLYFSGFIFAPSPMSEFLNYFSMPSWRTFTNITWYLEDHRIFFSHDNLLLTTGAELGMPWNIVNPLTLTEITTPSGFFVYEHVISAAICCQIGADYKLFFLVSSLHRGQGTWIVTLSKTATASGRVIRQRRSRLSGDVLSSIRHIQLEEIRPAVHAIFASRCFVCVLFPESKQVLVVCCRSQDYWVFEVSHGNAAGGEYGLCQNAAREVHLTWVSGKDMVLCRLQLNRVNCSEYLEPCFEVLHELRIEHFTHFPGLRIEHIERGYVYLRYGPYGKYIQPYNIQTSSMKDVIELPFSMGEEADGEDEKWPPVFAYSSYLGDGEGRWQD